MRLRTVVLRAVLVLTVIAAVLAAGLHWASRSEAVLRWAVDRVAAQLPGKLTVSGLSGALVRPITIERLQYEQDGLRIVASEVAIDWSAWVLVLADRVWIRRLTAGAVTIESRSPTTAPPALPQHLRLPLAVRIDRLEVSTLRAEIDGRAVQLSTIALAYEGSHRFHHLDLERVVSEWGTLNGELQLQADRPFALSGAAKLDSAALPGWPLVAQAALGGTLENLDVTGEVVTRELKLSMQARVAPFMALPLRNIRLQSAGVQLSRLIDGAPQAELELTLEGVHVAQTVIEGELRAVNRMPGSLDAQRLPLQALTAHFSAAPDVLRLTQLQLDLGPAGRASGAAELRGDGLQTQLAVEQLDLHALHTALRPTALGGSVQARNSPGVQQVAVDLAQQGIRVSAAATHRDNVLQVASLAASWRTARLDASGQIATLAPYAFKANANLRRVDPAELGEFPAATINGEVEVSGHLQPQWSTRLAYRLRNSVWRQQALSGRGTLTLSARRAQAVDASLALGPNRLQLRGAIGATEDRLEFGLDAPALSVLSGGWAGRVRASGTVQGLPARGSLRATAAATDLVVPGGYRAQDLQLKVELGDGEDPRIALDASATLLRAHGVGVKLLRVHAEGKRSRHVIQLDVAREAIALNAALEGALAPDWRLWSGRVVALRNSGNYAFELESPCPLSISLARIAFGPAAVRSTYGRLALGETVYGGGRLSGEGSVTGLRVEAVLALFGAPPAVRTDLLLGGSWKFSSAEHVDGRFELHRQSGDIGVTVDDEQLAAGLEQLSLIVEIVQDRLAATLAATGSATGRLTGSAQTQLSQRGGAWGVAGNAPLRASVRADVTSLKPFAAVLSRELVADGVLALALDIGGTVGDPQLSGRIDGNALRIEQLSSGILLRDGTLQASVARNRLELQQLSMRGGEGRLGLRGAFSFAQQVPEFSIDWTADRLAAVQRPDVALVVTGAGKVSGDLQRIELKGELRADSGRVDLRDLSAPALGSDVVVKGRKVRTPVPERILRPAVDVKVDLGPDFRVSGRGIDARLQGSLWLRSPGNSPLSAEGEISVARGTYEAYGRKLDIDPGRLYFNGALDNPGLDIRALRKNQQVIAGVAVTGTARDPRVRLVSIPDVPDVEKLAWLTLGRPLEAGNRSDAETMQRYALVVATAVGTGSFQSRVAQAVGLDEITYSPSLENKEAGMLILGKRLSDRIYILFEQNLGTAQNAFKVSYQLTPRWSLRTETGVTDALDVFYTWSFD